MNPANQRAWPSTCLFMDRLRDIFPDLPSLLAQVRRVPSAFGIQRTSGSLGAFLCGIELAEDFHEIPDEERYGRFDRNAFGAWVTAVHNPRRLEGSSFYFTFRLAEQTAGSDDAGFDLWFRWYDEFHRG